MSDWHVVLSAPLCLLLFAKFGKLHIKRIKTALLNFYPSEEVTAVKERLNKHAQAWNLDEMPTITKRRNSDNRYQRECDDIVDIATYLNERKLSVCCRVHYALELRSFRVRRHAFAMAHAGQYARGDYCNSKTCSTSLTRKTDFQSNVG